MLDRFCASLVCATACLLLASLSLAQEPACHPAAARRPIAGDTIGLVYDPILGADLVDRAIDVWRSCPNYRSDFPALVHGAHAAATVFVELVQGNSGSKRCGFFSGRTIKLYRWARTSDRSVRSCGSLALNLAHELGHVLGLRDALDTARCDSRIMADLERNNLFRRAVSSEECRLVGARWRTLAELDSTLEPLPADQQRPATREP